MTHAYFDTKKLESERSDIYLATGEIMFSSYDIESTRNHKLENVKNVK